MSRRLTDDEDDVASDVSLTSTLESEPDLDKEYEIEAILAERPSDLDGHKEWLVKWAGYPPEDNTWEPRHSFPDDSFLETWNQRKTDIAQGRALPFDVEAWEELRFNIWDTKSQLKRSRRAKRRAKRRALGMPVESTDESDEPDQQESSTDDEPLAITRARATRRASVPRPPLQIQPKPVTQSELNRIQQNVSSTGQLSAPSLSKPSSLRARRTRDPLALVSRRDRRARRTFSGRPRAENLDGTGDLEGKSQIPWTINDVYRQLYAPKPEPKPDLAAICYIDAKTGKEDESVRAGFQHQARLNEGIREGKRRASDFGSASPMAVGPVQDGNARQMAAEHDFSNPERAAEFFGATGKIPATCMEWARWDCLRPEESCRFLHFHTNCTAYVNEKNQYPEKFAEQPLTCFWWWQKSVEGKGKGCSKPDIECNFAHWNTGVLADRISGLPASTSRSVEPRTSGPTKRKASTDQKKFACLFWIKGNCRYSDFDCDFSHDNTAERPADHRKKSLCGFWIKGDCKCSDSKCPYAHGDGGGRAAVPQSPSTTYDPVDIPRRQAPPLDMSFLGAAKNSSFESPASAPAADAFSMHLQVPGNDGTFTTLRTRVFGLTSAVKESLGLNESSQLTLFINTFCLARDYETYVSGEGGWSELGNIQPADLASSASDFADHLRLHDGGAVVIHEDVTAVIYPAGSDSWNFLKRSANATPGALLRIHVQARSPNAALKSPDQAPVRKDSIPGAISDLLGIEPASLFKNPDGRRFSKRVFLIFDSKAHVHEIQLLSRLFHAYGADVFHTGIKGSWRKFLGDNRGVILIHSSIKNYPKIPDFQSATRKNNVFQVGCDSTGTDSLAKYSCKPIFKEGRVYFIADEIFEDEPKQAWQLVDSLVQFRRILKKRHPGWMNSYKLAARPGLKQWALELWRDHAEDLQTGNKDRQRLYHSIEVAVRAHESPSDPADLAPESPIISVPPSTMPKHHALYKIEPRGATDMMVSWFAGWAILNAENFMDFCVVTRTGQEPEWMTRYQHLRVISLKECKEYFRKKAYGDTPTADGGGGAVRAPKELRK